MIRSRGNTTVFCCDYLRHSNHFVDNFGNFKKGLYLSKLVALRNLPYALSNFPILQEMGSQKEVLGSFSTFSEHQFMRTPLIDYIEKLLKGFILICS